MDKYIIPEVGSKKFTCPYCKTITQNRWEYHTFGSDRILARFSSHENMTRGIDVSLCTHCSKNTIWYIMIVLFLQAKNYS